MRLTYCDPLEKVGPVELEFHCGYGLPVGQSATVLLLPVVNNMDGKLDAIGNARYFSSFNDDLYVRPELHSPFTLDRLRKLAFGHAVEDYLGKLDRFGMVDDCGEGYFYTEIELMDIRNQLWADYFRHTTN